MLPQMDNLKLNMTIKDDEIFKVIQQFHQDKGLGLDGFTLDFYKIFWSIIKFDFIIMLRYVQKSNRMGGATKSSLLVLILKEKGVACFD
jgi:hypothetical protein